MVLLLGFRPFAGRGINGSETFVRALGGSEINGEPIVSVALDVVWGAPGRNLPELVTKHRPRLVLGFGEGSWDGLSFEREAVNLAVGRDEAGVLREGEALDLEGEDRRRSSLPFEPSWFAGENLPVRESTDAGAFLCNSLLYHGLASGMPPFGFVHLPVQGDLGDEAYLGRVLPVGKTFLERLP